MGLFPSFSKLARTTAAAVSKKIFISQLLPPFENIKFFSSKIIGFGAKSCRRPVKPPKVRCSQQHLSQAKNIWITIFADLSLFSPTNNIFSYFVIHSRLRKISALRQGCNLPCNFSVENWKSRNLKNQWNLFSTVNHQLIIVFSFSLAYPFNSI